MINYFDKIIPEKISIIYLEKSLISLCYKYCDNLRVNFPFKKDFKIKIDQKSSQNFEQNHILYFYPRQFYKEEKLVYLFFFFEFTYEITSFIFATITLLISIYNTSAFLNKSDTSAIARLPNLQCKLYFWTVLYCILTINFT